VNEHPDLSVLEAYRNGSLEEPTATSVEAHLPTCPPCRRSVLMPSKWLDRSWTQISVGIRLPAPTRVELALTRLGVGAATARLLVRTPSLRLPWLIALTVTLVFAALGATLGTTENALVPFLIAAPLAPVIGVALAYSRSSDPIQQITTVAPIDPLRLLLLRSSAVSATGISIAAIADLAFIPPDRSWIWILPTLALTTLTLAVGTYLHLWVAATAVGTLWLLGIGGLAITGDVLIALRQTGWITIILLAAGLVIVARRDSYRRLHTR